LASNNDGVWGKVPAILKIHVQTPFWESWWFYTFLGFFLACVFSIFYIVRIVQLQRFNKELGNAYHDVGIAEKKYRSIFENAVEGIFQVSPIGQLINANPAAASIMGFTSPTEMQQELVQVRDWVQCSQHAWLKLISRLIKNGAIFNHQLQVRRKTGEIIWLAVNVRLISDESGNMQYLDGLLEDITLRKKADEQLRQNQEFLEQLVYERTKKYQEINENLQQEILERERVEEELLRARKLESIGVLAGGIAHDFNNLMTVILGNINLLQLQWEHKDSPELNNAVQALHRAMDLTKKFITFSSGGDPVKKIHNIEKITRSAVELTLSGSNIQAIFSVENDLQMVEIDPSQVSQAMYNIIENSKQAMPQGGTLEVELSNLTKNGDKTTADLPIAKGDYIMVRFRDQGRGIPPEHLPKIFDPYFTTATKGSQKGKGLGLTIAYSIIKKHGGYIFAESIMEEGTLVRLLLPAVTEKNKADEAKPIPAASQGNKKKILLMDDEKMLRDMAKMMLGTIGYEVTVAADGDAAVNLYKQAFETNNPYDLVILDLTIPGGMGGKEVMETLQQLDPGLIAIVSSGYADDPVVSNYRQYGFIDALSKPYNMQEMKNLLSRIFST
jgi:PAS domain S-box-containing protein